MQNYNCFTIERRTMIHRFVFIGKAKEVNILTKIVHLVLYDR